MKAMAEVPTGEHWPLLLRAARAINRSDNTQPQMPGRYTQRQLDAVEAVMKTIDKAGFKLTRK